MVLFQKTGDIIMKKMTALFLLTLSLNAFSYSTTQAVAYTLAETIYVTALTVATSEVSTNLTSAETLRKEEANKIQQHVQAYFQSGEISVFLAEKINQVSKIDSTLSIDESVDALVEASNIILSK
jgi:hypothetical protein